MDSTQPAAPANPPPEANRNILEAIKQLQWLVIMTSLGMLLVCFALCWFLSRQVRLTQARIADEQPTFSAMVSNYQAVSEPLITNFLGALQQFAKTNRDFQPILDKYRPALTAYLPAQPGQRTGKVAPTNAPKTGR